MRVAMLVGALVIFAGQVQAQQASPEAWGQTTLDLKLTKKFISNEKCRTDSKFFESCYQAIESASRVVGQPGENDYPADYDFEAKLEALISARPPEVPAQMILGTAINTQLKFFDAHAYLLPVADPLAKQEQATVGLGISAYKSSRGFLVDEVISNSPAKAGGLLYGDRIVAVGEKGQPLKDVTGISPVEFGKLVQGVRGSVIQVQVDRGSGEKILLKVRRDLTRRLAVESSLLPQDADIGYIRVRLFVRKYTCQQIALAFEQLSRRGATSFILDLRGNVGGDFDEALCINGLMLGLKDQVGILNIPVTIPAPELIRIFNRSSKIEWYVGHTTIPIQRRLAILMDEHAGSSSEIVAGALQYHKQAWIVGKQSFGKGLVQALETVADHPSLSLSATTKRLYFPNNKSHQRVGITPSFPVPTVLGLKDGELLEEREGDVNPNAPEAVNEAWPDERQEQIAEINACISEKKLDTHYLNRLIGIGADYPRAYAAAVLKCAK